MSPACTATVLSAVVDTCPPGSPSLDIFLLPSPQEQQLSVIHNTALSQSVSAIFHRRPNPNTGRRKSSIKATESTCTRVLCPALKQHAVMELLLVQQSKLKGLRHSEVKIEISTGFYLAALKAIWHTPKFGDFGPLHVPSLSDCLLHSVYWPFVYFFPPETFVYLNKTRAVGFRGFKLVLNNRKGHYYLDNGFLYTK